MTLFQRIGGDEFIIVIEDIIEQKNGKNRQ